MHSGETEDCTQHKELETLAMTICVKCLASPSDIVLGYVCGSFSCVLACVK